MSALGRGLGGGRGLGALIPGAPSRATPFEVPHALIEPDPEQPRRRFDEAQLEELTTSVRAHGVLQPIVVREVGGGRYKIIAGERRWRAAGRAGLERVPIVCREASDAEAFELAILENIQRADLSPIEEAASFARLIDEFGLSQEEVAARTGKSRAAVSNAVRLLRLPDDLRALVDTGELSAGHGRALLSLEREEDQRALAAQILTEGLSVRRAESWAAARATPAAPPPPSSPAALNAPRPSSSRHGAQGPVGASEQARGAPPSPVGDPASTLAPPPPSSPPSPQAPSALPSDAEARAEAITTLERSLAEELRRGVKISLRQRGGGQLTLSFGDDEDLMRLAEFLGRRW